MFVLWAVLGVLLALAGLVGCLLPIVPGPPVAFLGFTVVWAARGFHGHTFGAVAPWVLLGATVLSLVLDYIAPALVGRRYGGTKGGSWGAVIGMLVGSIAFPPLGLILGAFVGALGGEIFTGQPTRRALRASWGVFLGTLLGTALKLALSGTLLWYVVVEIVG